MKNGFIKIKDWFKNHMPTKRRLIQVYAALLYNANIKGFITGDIFKGDSKHMCVPGLNCYSCPGAIGACPLGSLQNALAASDKTVPTYVLGIILLFGLTLGRTICGALCPMGLLQELLFKFKTPKIRKSNITRAFSYLKYVILVVFVIILPIMYMYANIPLPAFCKYICPAGIVEGAVSLLSNPNNANMLSILNIIFSWKFILLIGFITMCIFMYRFFCRFFCPLGAIYGFFNQFSFLGIQVNHDSCTSCGKCVNVCKMDVHKVGDHECINCGECINVCPTNAISWKGSQLFLHPNQINTPVKEQKVIVEEQNDQNVDNNEENNSKSNNIERKKKVFKITAVSVASVVLISALVYANFIHQDEARINVGNNVGDKCPTKEIAYYLKDGTFSIENNQGKITVINFWHRYCTPCVKEIPHFEEIANEYKETVEIIAIAGMIYGDEEDFIKTNNWDTYTMSFGMDTPEQDPYFKTLGGADAYPYTVIVDEEGIIQEKIYSSITYDKLKASIDTIINK